MPVLASLLPLLIAGLRIMLIATIVGFVLRILVVMGFSFFVMDPITDQLMAMISGEAEGLPSLVVDWLAFMNFDKYISLILSAAAIATATNFVLRLNQPT